MLTDPAAKVRGGADYQLFLPAPKPAEPQAEAIALDILYEDAHLIVLNKPAGMVVHPAPGAESGTLVNALIAHCGDSLSGIGGVLRPGHCAPAGQGYLWGNVGGEVRTRTSAPVRDVCRP